MKPQYVRIIIPSNKQIQLLAPMQQKILQHPRPCLPAQVRLITSNASVVSPSAIPSTLENNAALRTPSASLNINQPICSTIVAASSNQEPPQIPCTSASASLENTFVQCDSIINIGPKKNKRGKNWSEEETAVFINIWSEYYESLMMGRTRNTKIYHAMAKQMNEFLSPRVMTGADVKAKITNLVAEYRKKRKESGKTGSSPSSWRYFEQIDKLLGERPFNDESLISDSISLQEEQFLEEIDNASASDLNLNSLTKDDDDDNISNLIKDIEESTNNSDHQSCNSKSPSNSISIQKNTTSNTSDISNKKNLSSKKKKVADMRIELIRQMINKIDGVNEIATKAESKALLLLEKQTKLQEENSVDIDWDISEPIYRKPTCTIQTTGSLAAREALTQYFLQNPI
ncbi:unnamed protein product [Rotaria sp. Silwood1]|nr:unnamed protein product [Rotaria sp. Silwood1]CAF3848642.1 unnamed protein product [Rotaria sp. Silwood1]CAF4814657.1 unnamed protein product [Rotaria sp. Silwood1]CAF4982499.1 unnamed protein product [Rotaria sp. Silwood1]CAF5022151.1 unnamed protein product [Rotaria sp. Silwood1]